MLKKQDNSQTFLERWHSSRKKLKRVRKLIEAKEEISCPGCYSSNVSFDEEEDFTIYECHTCGMRWSEDD